MSRHVVGGLGQVQAPTSSCLMFASAVMVYLQGAGMVYYQWVCACWRMSSIKSHVSGVFVKGHCALSSGCSILYI